MILDSLKTLARGAALLLAATALPACAQAPQPKHAANDADPALWVVKDHDTTIYLFGTIHVLKPGLSWFDEAVKAAFDKSDTLVLELVMPDPATMQGLVMAKGVEPSGPTLTERLPADKRAPFARAVADLGMPAGALDRMKPWLAATTLSVAPLGKLGYAQANGPEEVLTEAAKAEKKPVIGLETAEQQLGYFATLSEQAQMEFLTSTLDELPKMPETMSEMVDDWAKGQPEKLAALLNDDLKKTPELTKVLLTERNQRWAKWVEERMKRPGTVFVAVGAGHLAGEQSVQAWLAKDGVKVTRVRY